MIKVNNKIAANWIKISSDLQSQLIASEEDKIKLLDENKRLREVVMEVTVSLIACHSLLSRGGKRAAASDKMFEIMLSDYEKAIEVGCAALQPQPEDTK